MYLVAHWVDLLSDRRFYSHIIAHIRKMWDQGGHEKTEININIVCNVFSQLDVNKSSDLDTANFPH